MAFDRPDLKTLISRTVTDITSRFTTTNNLLRRMVARVFGRVLAGLAHGLYGYVDWASLQILPDTQDEDILLRYGAIFGVTRTEGAYAAGTVTATGTDGSVIPGDTLWQRSDGVTFTTLAEAEISGGTATVSLRAEEIGDDGNTDAGETLDLVSPIDGVNASATIDSGGISGGRDVETVDAYRQRVMQRTATYFTGANAAVYKQWALECAGVTRAWVYENTPADGSVTLLFVCDDSDPVIPDAGKITEIGDYIEEHTDANTGQLVGRAVNVTMVVDAPDEEAIDFTITPTPNTAAVRAAIEAELTALLRSDGEPGGTIYLSRIHEAISLAKGETSHIVSVPANDVVCSSGAIPVMGTITWP